MKIATLLAGVAAIALTASAASADTIDRGQFVHQVSGVTVGVADYWLPFNRLRAQGNPDPTDQHRDQSAWHAFGGSQGDNGTAAGADGVAGAASPTSLVLGAASNSVSAQHGAWKSAMALNVNIPVPSKSLLAGSYQGDLTVNIAAF